MYKIDVKNAPPLHLALYVDFTQKEREFIMGNNSSNEELNTEIKNAGKG